MKKILFVLFISIGGMLPICQAKDTYSAKVFGMRITGGYTYRSGMQIINPSQNLVMNVTIPEVNREYTSTPGGDIFVTTEGLTNQQNHMSMKVVFIDEDGKKVGWNMKTARVSFRSGAWNGRPWTPQPKPFKEFKPKASKVAKAKPEALAEPDPDELPRIDPDREAEEVEVTVRDKQAS